MAATTARKPKPRPADVCRLTLTIRGVAYAVRKIDAPSLSVSAVAYRLRRRGAGPYTVARTPHGPVCDCGDFT